MEIEKVFLKKGYLKNIKKIYYKKTAFILKNKFNKIKAEKF